MVSLALRFRPLILMDVLVRQLGTAPAVKSGETGFGRCFGLHQNGNLDCRLLMGILRRPIFLSLGNMDPVR